MLFRSMFEVGLQEFPLDIELIKNYLKFLWNINEWDYGKVLLDRVLKKLGTCKVLWDLYVEYESRIGDTIALDKLYEKRRENCELDNEPPLQRILTQASFLDVQPFSEYELKVVEGLDTTFVASKMNGVSGSGGRARDSSNGQRDNSRSSANRPRTAAPPPVGGLPNNLEAKLYRLAASMPRVRVPPPEPEFVFSQILQTPDKFKDTPAGKKELAGGGGAGVGTQGMNGGMTVPDLTGQKRPLEISGAQEIRQMPPPQPMTGPPPIDLFRARQQAGR